MRSTWISASFYLKVYKYDGLVFFMQWIQIHDNNDISNLLNIFNHFHDSCLTELYMWTESYVDEDFSMKLSIDLDTNVRILFQRQLPNPSAIELLFEAVTDFHIVPSPIGYVSTIFEGKIEKIDDNFIWSEDSGWKPNSNDFTNSWISSKRLKWRDVSSWIGNSKRYGLLNDQ